MRKEEKLQRLLVEKMISIVRLKDGEIVSKVVDNLVKGGIRALEITSNTPNFGVHITAARKRHPDILVGAGTITTIELSKIAIKAGAQFLVTPNTSKGVVDEAKKTDIPVVMGALTPTEVANAVSFGADIIKLFPAGQLGVSYYKTLKGPFPDTRFFAVGGIGVDNIKDWLEAGIHGLGIGSTIVKQEMNTQEDLENIILKAHQFKELIKTHEYATD